MPLSGSLSPIPHQCRGPARDGSVARPVRWIMGLALPTDEPDRDYFNVGVSAVFAQGRSAFITVESVLGQDDATEHTIEAGMRLEF